MPSKLQIEVLVKDKGIMVTVTEAKLFLTKKSSSEKKKKSNKK